MLLERSADMFVGRVEMGLHRPFASIGVPGPQGVQNGKMFVDGFSQGAKQTNREMAHAQDFVHRMLQNEPCRSQAADLGDRAMKLTVDDNVFNEVRLFQGRQLLVDESA